MTIAEAYNGFYNNLTSIYEEREADNITDWIFENVTKLKRWERRDISKEINAEQQLQLHKYLQELLLHKPVQYVLNEAWFYKMKFFVNEHVLIPRPETEELISWIVSDVRSMSDDIGYREIKLLDIGTGSGCIAISLKKELHDIEIKSIDVSQQALSVARKNADALQAKIDFMHVDFLNEKECQQLDKYDIIVSNPPYIPGKEKEQLSKNVTAFEPALALFVHDNDPFIFYKNIGKFSKSHLNKGGKIYVEIHEKYANEVRQIFTEYDFKTEIKKDIFGKERMIKLIKDSNSLNSYESN